MRHDTERSWHAALLAVVALLGAVLAAGCSSLVPKLETPKLSLVGLEIVDATLFEQRLKVRLRVQNPNDVTLPVRGLTVNFELDGEEFAHGMSSRSFEVPALGEAEFDMMVTANAATAILRMVSRARDRDEPSETIDYRITGKLSTSLGLLRTVPFEHSGRVPLGQLTGRPREAV